MTFIAAISACLKADYKSSATAEASIDSSMKTNREANGEVPNTTPLSLPLVEPKIVVAKSKRRLTLYADGKAVRVYRVGLGFNPVGDKEKQGDGRTPEGEFYVCVKNASSSYYLSLGLSYPGKPHAQRGLQSGLVTRAQYDGIISALERRARPPWSTGLGGEIFIHGHGSSSDWTLGCVALDNRDMKELFDAVPKGTSVLIEP
jgi:murein L,D-transpeptidase YafK